VAVEECPDRLDGVAQGVEGYLITLSISWQGCGPFETGGPGYEIELTGGANRLTVDTR
jgi:hypothetical protein